MAKRAFPQFETTSVFEAPRLYTIIGRSLWGQKRHTEVYRTYKRAISSAQQILARPAGQIKSEEHNYSLYFIPHCQEMLTDLEAKVKWNPEKTTFSCI